MNKTAVVKEIVKIAKELTAKDSLELQVCKDLISWYENLEFQVPDEDRLEKVIKNAKKAIASAK
jgi:hypothetical protein